ncbi:MAG: DNA polymerase I [Candidatus Cloacimonadaceae bacterium]|nr:DNA polymerase I [Candidatus Cloacimonadaceae bacterium]
MSKTLYLIDGTALLYRSHFAFIKNPLTNSKGQNTSAIFGVINSFLSLIENRQAEYLLISFDRKAPTFRHELSKAYKANRPPMPDDLIAQLAPVHDFFHRIGMPEISLDGFEADDVLATLAEHFKKDFEVMMVTTDKDFSQLVEERVKMLDPSKNIEIGSAEVFNKYGVYPEQFIDYLAIMGDSSDNIPGVRGIGPKGAESLLKEFGSLDNIYANLDKIPEKVKSKLIENQKNAYLSQRLATIIRDVPIDITSPDTLRFDPRRLVDAIDYFDQYELMSLKRRIEARYGRKETQPVIETPKVPREEELPLAQADIFGSDTPPPLIEKEEAADAFNAFLVDKTNFSTLLNEVSNAEIVSLDTETDSIDPMLANLVGVSICFKTEEAWYIPLAHQMHDNLDMKGVIEALQEKLRGKLIVGHNLKYDMIVLKRHGWEIDNPIFDTVLAAYILDPGTNQYSLDACAMEELGHTMIPISALIGSGKKQVTFDLVDVRFAAKYAAEDAWVVFRIYPIYRKRLDNSNMRELYDEIELPLVRVIERMEENGVSIDTGMLHEISKTLNREIKLLTEKIYDYAGYRFNLNSTQQLAKLLFEEKKLPSRKKTKSGFSTDSSVLETLAEDYQIADDLIQYRQLAKLESTYVSALPKLINPATGRIHSSFNQTVASTGRLSSSNPNLQNIPVRTELGRAIRKAFVAKEEGFLILAADYSQIELRLLALFSRDEVLIDAFHKGIDIHRQTAALITDKSLAEVSGEERRQAKAINFGLLYGMGQKKLARELGISQDRAKELITNYFERFPSIRAFINNCIANARRERYCETLFGRRLYLRNINSPNQGLKSEAERVSVNMPIQGSAADLIKIAMLDIHALIKADDRIRMIMQVHDELVFEVHKDSVERATALIRDCMENALPQEHRNIVEIKTDISHGASWFDAH